MAAWAKNRKTLKQHLLQGHLLNFKIISQEYSLGDPLPKLLRPFRSDEKEATRAENRKTFKRLFLVNQWMDLKIIINECYLGDPLPKLLKLFCSDEQDGRQS